SRRERKEDAKNAKIKEDVMEKVKDILVVMVGISFIVVGLGCASGPNIPKERTPSNIPSDVRKQNISKEKIPSDIPSDVREKIKKLYSLDARERAYGAYHLGKEGAKAAPAIPFLIGILGDDASLAWSWDALVYPFRGHDLGKPTSPGEEAANALEEILEKIKDPRAVEPLIAALKDEDSDIRERVAEVLGKIKNPRAVEPLIAALKDENWYVREQAAWALGEIKNPRAVEPLIAVFKDEVLNVRGKAAWALGEIKDPRAVEPLIATIKAKGWEVRCRAAEALGEIKDPRAIQPLIAALKDEDSRVQEQAALALEGITDQDFGEDPVKWQEWWEENKGKFSK
ncbi:MAG: HEAT repeat domain-containing protein, partial [Candidatus Hydrothermarchaeales archaeon]